MNHPQFPSSRIDIILERQSNLGSIILTGILGATNYQELQYLNVQAILSVGSEFKNTQFPGIIQKLISIQDVAQDNISQHFTECIDFIDEQRDAGRNVLVHCYVGVSRSVSIILAYLMWREGKTLQEAYTLVHSKRPYINPNLGFMNQLVTYDQELLRIRGTQRQPQQQQQQQQKQQYLNQSKAVNISVTPLRQSNAQFRSTMSNGRQESQSNSIVRPSQQPRLYEPKKPEQLQLYDSDRIRRYRQSLLGMNMFYSPKMSVNLTPRNNPYTSVPPSYHYLTIKQNQRPMTSQYIQRGPVRATMFV